MSRTNRSLARFFWCGARLAWLVLLLGVRGLEANAEAIQLQRDAGTYLLPVRVNDAITRDFLLDTGASEVTLPADVFLTLVRAHTINEDDFVGIGEYVLADGTKQTSRRFRLRQLQVGSHVIPGVIADVTPIQSNYPLLGQSFLSRISAWSIDNKQALLVLGDETTRSESVPGRATDALQIVKQFYDALRSADGTRASSLVISEKRGTGPFSAEAISRFYSGLAEPLRLVNVTPSGLGAVLAEYTYVLSSGRRCDGRSIVYLTTRAGGMLIERIQALSGC